MSEDSIKFTVYHCVSVEVDLVQLVYENDQYYWRLRLVDLKTHKFGGSSRYKERRKAHLG